MFNEVIDAVIARLRMGWCKGYAAVDCLGQQVYHSDKYACAWCLAGAMRFGPYAPITRLYNKMRDYLGVASYKWNDQQKSVEPVIALLEKMKE